MPGVDSTIQNFCIRFELIRKLVILVELVSILGRLRLFLLTIRVNNLTYKSPKAKAFVSGRFYIVDLKSKWRFSYADVKFVCCLFLKAPKTTVGAKPIQLACDF